MASGPVNQGRKLIDTFPRGYLKTNEGEDPQQLALIELTKIDN